MEEEKSLIGTEILNYRIDSLIGSGGMGKVYLATNKHINAKVAIKMIHADLAESSIVRQKFIQEAKALLALNHPNIVHFLNFYENEDGLFLIMEYVDGITLDDFINKKNGLIVESRVYNLFNQILDAFNYAHKEGVIHRDIKPANIILTYDNEGNFIVKVLDFGIARIISESNDDEKGLVVGTPLYMSPEQVRGEETDKRSDIYSLGVLLHQMLTGRAPYDSTTLSELEIQQKVVESPLPRMKEYYQGISDRMQRIVDKATAKHPAGRYPNCAAFCKDFLPKPPIPLWKKMVAAIVFIFLVGSGWWYYDYNYVTKTYYYKDYVEQWGVPVGVGRNADYKNRLESYRFEKKRGKVIRVSHVNSKGKIDRHHDSEHWERYDDIKINYTEDGKINNIEVYDKNGKMLYLKDYEKDITTVVFKQDHRGTEIFLASSTTELFSSAFDNARDQKSKITRYLLTYDENGFVIKVKYATFGNELVGDAEGLYGREYIVDGKGRIKEEHYLGYDGNIKANKAGLAIKKFEYDNNDDWTKVTYFAANGEMSSDGNGCPIVILDNDKYGNRIKESYYNDLDSLTLRTDCNVAGFVYTIEKGNRIRQAAFGIDGQSCYYGDFGFSVIETEYDENGYAITESYKDADGNAVMRSDGFATAKNVNDSRGNPLEKQYFDSEGNVCETASGYAKEICEYDSLGNLMSVFCYGSNDSLCLLEDNYAGIRIKYNDKNKVIEYSYYGTDQSPCAVNGLYIKKKEYDKRGNETKTAFYAADGQTLVLNNSSNIAGYEYTYDENGNIKTMWYFDVNGNHSSGNYSYAGYECSYDENGYLEEITNLDKNGNLVYVVADGYARIKYVNDERGNRKKISKYDSGNRLVGATECRVFDSRDNIIERTYFDGNGNKIIYEGYHKLVSMYNDRHQEIEARAYGTNDRLVNTPFGYSIMKVKYNNQGFITEYATYNISEKLVVSGNSGYAMRRIEYDAMNRERRVAYFDENSNPASSTLCIPEELKQYDKWGNLNYFAYANGNGNLINHPKIGYAIIKWLYDAKGNILERAFFDKDEKPYISMNHKCHKMTYVYNEFNKEIEVWYYSNSTDLRKSSYAIVRLEYNEKKQMTEWRCYDYLDKPLNHNDFYQKVNYTYNDLGEQIIRKYYDKNGKQVLITTYNKKTGEWDRNDNLTSSNQNSNVSSSSSSGWRENWQTVNEKCPFRVNDETEVTSVTITSNSCTFTISFSDVSKYSITGDDLKTKKEEAGELLKELRTQSEMPNNIPLTVICTDKAKRELFRITK